MPPKQSRPLSFTDRNGKTTEFSSGSEMWLFIRKYHSHLAADADKGIDYAEWNEGEVSTAEDIKACYERKK